MKPSITFITDDAIPGMLKEISAMVMKKDRSFRIPHTKFNIVWLPSVVANILTRVCSCLCWQAGQPWKQSATLAI